MAADELFKRYLEIGASILGMSRQRADAIVGDLVASGEVAKEQAAKAADWLVERGRAGTEELAELIRREVRQQVAALGLATRDDIARIEARLDGAGDGPAATRVATRVEPAPPGSGSGPEGAGITRSGSVRRPKAPPESTPPKG